jgi:hypothetical protein
VRPPRTFHTRNLIQKLENIQQTVVIDKESAKNLITEFADIFSYIVEIESLNTDLQDKIDRSENLQVEMVGKDF